MVIRNLLLALMASSSLFANAITVVFDFGGVMTGEPNRELVASFLCDSFQLLPSEFEVINLEKRKAIKEEGINDLQFWLRYAGENNIALKDSWEKEFRGVLKTAIGVNQDMYRLVDELKERNVPVALLSNIDMRLAAILRELDLYHPFETCLLSCEIGAEKPDQKAYQAALDTLKIPANKIVFIDDRIENIEAAKQMGLDSILFESSSQIRAELIKRELLNSP